MVGVATPLGQFIVTMTLPISYDGRNKVWEAASFIIVSLVGMAAWYLYAMLVSGRSFRQGYLTGACFPASEPWDSSNASRCRRAFTRKVIPLPMKASQTTVPVMVPGLTSEDVRTRAPMMRTPPPMAVITIPSTRVRSIAMRC